MARVLFADDEPWFVESYAARLQEEGHDVLHAKSAQEALKTLWSPPVVNVLVLDIMMPEKPLLELLKEGIHAVADAPKQSVWTGIRLYRQIQQDYPNLKVVVLSVLPEAEIRAHAPDVKFACSFLRKGEDDPEHIYETIRRALEPHSDRNRQS